MEAKSRPLPVKTFEACSVVTEACSDVGSDTGNGRVVAVPSNIGGAVAVTGVKPSLVLLSRPRSEDTVDTVFVEKVAIEAAALVVGKVVGGRVDAGVSALVVVVERVDTGVSAPALPSNVNAKPMTPLPPPTLLILVLPFLR